MLNQVELRLYSSVIHLSFHLQVGSITSPPLTCLYCTCISDYKTAKACWNSSITLDCSNAEQDIEVIAAHYGRRQNSPICTKNGTTVSAPALYNDSCMAPNVLPKLQTICDYRSVCKIELNDDVFPHDCTSEAPLEMFVVYQCNLTKRKYTELENVSKRLVPENF